MAEIGKWNRLMAVELADHGLMLDGGEEHGLILAPTKYLPEDAEPGEEFDVFVYLDSEDRLIATTEQPLAEVGDFACLEVVGVHPKVGAFLDWGLAKDLLLPFAEQVGPRDRRVAIGDRVVVAVQIDSRSGRIFASMRTRRYLDRTAAAYHDGQPVSVLISEATPLGLRAIINHAHSGLLYHSEVSTAAMPVAIGQTIDAWVRCVRPDGRIDLTLTPPGSGSSRRTRAGSLAEDILEALRHSPDGRLDLGDKSPPEQIRAVFGVSKKVYKQALGKLYKQRRIVFEDEGVRLLKS